VGFNDEGIVEIVAHVALYLFTNDVNMALNAPVDFPKVPLRRAAWSRPAPLPWGKPRGRGAAIPETT
jgi:hypothetical protein